MSSFLRPISRWSKRSVSDTKEAGLARHTVVSYKRDWRVFCAWCAAAGRESLPATAETTEFYASAMLRLGRKVSTVERHAAGIHHYHRQAGLASPCGPGMRDLLSGARRMLCHRPEQRTRWQAQPATEIRISLTSTSRTGLWNSPSWQNVNV